MLKAKVHNNKKIKDINYKIDYYMCLIYQTQNPVLRIREMGLWPYPGRWANPSGNDTQRARCAMCLRESPTHSRPHLSPLPI